MKCEQCGNDRQPAHACKVCHPPITPQQADFRALRREAMLALITGEMDTIYIESDDNIKLLWNEADRIARAEPKE